MRDAFGGTFMIRIMLVFIFLFVFFIAIALNYAKAFRIKNEIIDYIESNQVVLSGGAGEQMLDQTLERISKKYSYGIACKDVDTSNGGKCTNGFKIEGSNTYESNGVMYYYVTVTVYINRDFGFLKSLLTLTSKSSSEDLSGMWAVIGKTKVILSDAKSTDTE